MIFKPGGTIKDNSKLYKLLYLPFVYVKLFLYRLTLKPLKNSKITEFFDLNPTIFHKIVLNSVLSKIVVLDEFPY